jgi:hypothetical protein
MLALGSFADSGEHEPIVRPSGLIQGRSRRHRGHGHSPVAFRAALGIRPGSSIGAICSVPHETEIVAWDRKKTSDKEMPWPS